MYLRELLATKAHENTRNLASAYSFLKNQQPCGFRLLYGIYYLAWQRTKHFCFSVILCAFVANIAVIE